MTINATPSQGVRCPRCDSPNTKFCYYNNYSLTQPRHFCKACRRYWTKGGALRNVPIGGGCRKNKRTKSSSSLPSSSRIPLDPFNHMEYLHPPTTLASPSIMGFQYPSFSASDYNGMGAIKTSTHYSNVDYIESLSSINQDLHSKLQQQRLQGLFYEAGFCKQASPFQGAENSIKAEVCGPDATTSTHVDDDGGISKWNGIVGWNDMHQFTALL